MKTIGMIGSVSWLATVDYYKQLNESIAQKLGGHHSAKIVMACEDFEILYELAITGCWEQLADVVLTQVSKLERAGANFFIICANTIHKVADTIVKRSGIPLLSIVETTTENIKKSQMTKVTLLGTRFTMEDGFYQRALAQHGIEVVMPEKKERDFIHSSILEELIQNKFNDSTKKEYLKIINKQIDQGTQGVILGCTEIPLIIKPQDVTVPLFDTTKIHVEAAVKKALE